jgi:lysophospholipase L1-like esterase
MGALRNAVLGLLVALGILAALDVGVRLWLPYTDRLNANFSADYLARETDALRGTHPIVVLGDSVLWGYGLRADQAAPALLRRRGLPVANLSYEGGSLPNTYAMLRLLLAEGVQPRLVVFNVNQKEFNAVDSAYATLHPSVEKLSWKLLPTSARAALQPTQSASGTGALQRGIESVWQLYGMRTDLRELLFGDVDAAHAVLDQVQRLSGEHAREQLAHRPTPDKFEGTYDLSPLAPDNVGMQYLRLVTDLLRQRHIAAVAILTPTNHTLLHEYIDVPQYQANLAVTRRALTAGGVRVLDLDAAFPATEFLDNDHLDARGNVVLADRLEPAMR